MEGKASTSQLLSQENLTVLQDEDEEEEDEITLFDFNSDIVREEEDYLELMIQKEINFDLNSSGFHHNWIKCARFEAISWICKVSTYFFSLFT